MYLFVKREREQAKVHDVGDKEKKEQNPNILMKTGACDRKANKTKGPYSYANSSALFSDTVLL